MINLSSVTNFVGAGRLVSDSPGQRLVRFGQTVSLRGLVVPAPLSGVSLSGVSHTLVHRGDVVADGQCLHRLYQLLTPSRGLLRTPRARRERVLNVRSHLERERSSRPEKPRRPRVGHLFVFFIK